MDSPEACEDHFPADCLELGVLLEVDEDVARRVEDEQPVAQNGHDLHPQRRLVSGKLLFRSGALEKKINQNLRQVISQEVLKRL